MKNLYRMMKLLLHEIHESNSKPKVSSTEGHTVCYECYCYAFTTTNDFLKSIVSERRLMHIENSFKQFKEMQNSYGKGIFKDGIKTGRIKHLFSSTECEICTKPIPKDTTDRYEIEMLA